MMPAKITTKDRLDLLMDWYGTLTPQSVQQLARFYAADAHFKDPFNDVHGIAAITAIYRHMFATTEQPRFVIARRIVDGDQAFVTWTFEFGLKGKPYVIAGGTHLSFDEDGLVILHRDYWDAAEELLQKLPLIGGPIRWLRGLFRTR